MGLHFPGYRYLKVALALKGIILASVLMAQVNCSYTEALLKYNQAVTAYSGNDYVQALQFFEYSEKCYLQIDCCDSLLARCYIGKAICQNKTGVFGGALESYQSAINLFDRVPGFPMTEKSRVYNNIALIYRRVGNLKLAAQCLGISLQLKTVINPDGPDLATGWNNLAQLLEADGDFDQALQYYEKAEGRFRQYDDYEHLVQLLSNKGMLLDRLGRTSEAIIAMEYAIKLFQRQISPDKLLKNSLLTNLGRVYFSDGEYAKAEGYYLDAMTTLDTNQNQLPVLTGLAMSFDRQGKINQADSVYRLMMYARGESRNAASESSANAALVYGISLLRRTPGSATGFKYLKLAAGEFIALHGKQHFSVANAYMHLADASLKAGRTSEAMDFANSGIQALLKNSISLDQQVPDFVQCRRVSPVIIELLELKALALVEGSVKQQGDVEKLKESLDYYKLTISLMQYYRKGMSAKSILRWSRLFSDIYGQAIAVASKVCDIQNDRTSVETLFNLIEWSKANVLRTRMEEADALKFSGLPDSLLTDYQATREVLNRNLFIREKELLRPNPDYKKLNALDSLISLAYYQIAAHMQLLASYSKAYKLWTNEYRWLNLTDLQKYIYSDEYLLQYFVGQEMIYVVIADHVNVMLRKWRTPEDLSNLSATYFRSIRLMNMDNYQEEGKKLCESLFGPVMGHIPKGSQVIILPDDQTANLAFELLIPRFDSINSQKRPHYLIEDYLFKYMLNARMLFSLEDSNRLPQEILAFLPDPGLDGAEEEAAEIESLAAGNGVKCSVYREKESLKQKFIQHLPGSSPMHVSTHARADMEHPDQSGMAFYAPPDYERSSEEDSLLYAGEIYNLKSGIPLLVLNACETGKGKIITGEGSMSLTRAFVMAGTKKIVSTLWRVNDTEAAKIISRFYNFYFKGDSPALALHKAKLSLLKEEKQIFPRNWGAYLYFGH
jgi:CHAT domain-containing protein/Flp pilus assembly protein TadD